jgi:integrase
MVRRHRAQPLPAGHTKESLLNLGLAKMTRDRYRKLIVKHLSMGFQPNLHGLHGRILQQDPISTPELKALRSAIQHYLKCNNLPLIPPDAVKESSQMMLGRARATNETKATRGAIDWEKLIFLLKEAVKRDVSIDTRLAIVVCWATALRTSEMSTVRAQDFRREPDGSYTLWVPKIHDPTLAARSALDEVKPRQVEHRGREALQHVLGKVTDRSAPLFPPKVWNQGRVNRLIREVAAANPQIFDPALEWDGAHCFRHGVATTILAETGQASAVKSTTGHKTDGMVRSYGRPNAARSVIQNRRKAAKKSPTKPLTTKKTLTRRKTTRR